MRLSATAFVLVTSFLALACDETSVGLPAALCQGPGNRLVVHGDRGDPIHPGTKAIVGGRFEVKNRDFAPKALPFTVFPQGHRPEENPDYEAWVWELEFTGKLGEYLAPGIYENTTDPWYVVRGADQPGLTVSGEGRSCFNSTGRYEIHELRMRGTKVESFTASFEQHCSGAAPALCGCIHFEE